MSVSLSDYCMDLVIAQLLNFLTIWGIASEVAKKWSPEKSWSKKSVQYYSLFSPYLLIWTFTVKAAFVLCSMEMIWALGDSFVRFSLIPSILQYEKDQKMRNRKRLQPTHMFHGMFVQNNTWNLTTPGETATVSSVQSLRLLIFQNLSLFYVWFWSNDRVLMPTMRACLVLVQLAIPLMRNLFFVRLWLHTYPVFN